MIRGIDSQIMIQRSADYAKQQVNQIQNVEQAKDFTTMMQKEKALHETKDVVEAKNAEERRVTREKRQGEDGHADSYEASDGGEKDYIEIVDGEELVGTAPQGEVGAGLDIDA